MMDSGQKQILFHIHNQNEIAICEVLDDGILIENVQDGLDLMAEADTRGARSIILHEKNITPEFFDLKSRLAGEILQKFVNYQVKLAIVGDFSKYESKSLCDFIRESNQQGQIYFVKTLDEALFALEKSHR
jgi:hypothetical protein